MTARAANGTKRYANLHNAKKPPKVEDRRFHKFRQFRKVRCDGCKKWKCGNEAGTFCNRVNMPVAGAREEAWKCGVWDATWYCVGCFMEESQKSYEEVCHELGFTQRANKKARYCKLSGKY